jgi:uncharacterized protein
MPPAGPPEAAGYNPRHGRAAPGLMSKILLFALVAVIAYFAFRFFRRPRPPAGPDASASESMVACARCGVHVPRSEALENAGRFFCSEEHRVLGSG